CTSQQRMSVIESYKTMFTDHSKIDRIGHVMARTFDLIGAIVRDGVESETVSDLIELLAQDRSFVMKRDINSNDPPRQFVFGISESFGLMINAIVEKRSKIQNIAEQNAINSRRSTNHNASLTVSLPHNFTVPIADHPQLDDFIVKEEDDIGMFDGHIGGDIIADNFAPVPGNSQHMDNIELKEEESPSGPPFNCIFCPRVFDTEKSLVGHTTRMHNKKTYLQKSLKRKFPCTICSFTFSSRSSLDIHMCLHTANALTSARMVIARMDSPTLLSSRIIYVLSIIFSRSCVKSVERPSTGGCN
ncbi:hypothetical protein PENTCL1PPCAC_25929, partial [Pristionchus entomophagus]